MGSAPGVPGWRCPHPKWPMVPSAPIPLPAPGQGGRLMEFHDKVLKCSECSAEFIFTAGEQMFFADKGFKNEPKRCKACKAKRAEGVGGGAGGRAVPRSGRKPKPHARNAVRKPPSHSGRRRAGPSSAVNAFSSGGRWVQPRFRQLSHPNAAAHRQEGGPLRSIISLAT